MNSIAIVLFAVVACTTAQVVWRTPDFSGSYQDYYKFYKPRHPRDLTWDKRVGNGKVFGALGQNDQGLFGKGGYNHQFFDDGRGKLQGQAYGERVLGGAGGSTNFGGRLDWANKNAQAGLDVSKTIHGGSGYKASGSGVWNLDKNTHLSAGGTVSQQFGRGRPDVGFKGMFEHRW